MQTKTCAKCGEEKLLEEFYKQKIGKFGRGSYCKVCNKAYNKKYREENKEATREYNVEYQKTCTKCGETKLLEDYHKNKDTKDGLYSKCKSCANAYQKKYREENKESIREKKKKYYKQQQEYQKNRKASDPMYKLRCGLRTQVINALRKGGWSKTTKTQEILGCDFEFFYEWIEDQFEEGMTWENHGEWHLDHIKPLAMASTEQEIMEFCHYSNYQPLWAFDNQSKGSLFEGERHTRKND